MDRRRLAQEVAERKARLDEAQRVLRRRDVREQSQRYYSSRTEQEVQEKTGAHDEADERRRPEDVPRHGHLGQDAVL